MRTILLLAVLIAFSAYTNAQELAVDSKGEPVFQFYSVNDARLQLNKRSPLSGSYLFDKKQSKGNTGMLLQLSILNSGDFPLIAKLRDIRPGAGIKLGYQTTISEFTKIDQTDKKPQVWGVNAFFNADNIKLYDTVDRKATKKYPLTYGIEGMYTFFFKNKNHNANWRKALSVYSAISSTWNDRNLLSYQEISKVIFRPDIIAMQDFDGRYGVLKENFFKYRMAISFPMFYKRINPTPYCVAIFGTQNSPSYHMGVFTNILSSSLKNSNTKMPSTFGVGFDWVYATEHLSPKINVFVKAAVSLGKLKD